MKECDLEVLAERANAEIESCLVEVGLAFHCEKCGLLEDVSSNYCASCGAQNRNFRMDLLNLRLPLGQQFESRKQLAGYCMTHPHQVRMGPALEVAELKTTRNFCVYCGEKLD